jgi:hypothetical protein
MLWLIVGDFVAHSVLGIDVTRSWVWLWFIGCDAGHRWFL